MIATPAVRRSRRKAVQKRPMVPPPPRDLDIFRLRYVEHYPIRLLAERFELSPTRIRQVCHRVRQWLIATLPPMDDDSRARHAHLAQHLVAEQLQEQVAYLDELWYATRDLKCLRLKAQLLMMLARLSVPPGTIEGLLAEAAEPAESPPAEAGLVASAADGQPASSQPRSSPPAEPSSPSTLDSTLDGPPADSARGGEAGDARAWEIGPWPPDSPAAGAQAEEAGLVDAQSRKSPTHGMQADAPTAPVGPPSGGGTPFGTTAAAAGDAAPAIAPSNQACDQAEPGFNAVQRALDQSGRTVVPESPTSAPASRSSLPNFARERQVELRVAASRVRTGAEVHPPKEACAPRGASIGRELEPRPLSNDGSYCQKTPYECASRDITFGRLMEEDPCAEPCPAEPVVGRRGRPARRNADGDA